MIRAISAAQTRPLRQSVLRPHQAANELVYPGDDAEQSIHLGWFDENNTEPGAVLSAFPQFGEPPIADCDWRLRGMAVSPVLRGRGVGRHLMLALFERLSQRAASGLWCNARTSAAGFYTRLGLHEVGARFELPDIGEHVRMARIFE